MELAGEERGVQELSQACHLQGNQAMAWLLFLLYSVTPANLDQSKPCPTSITACGGQQALRPWNEMDWQRTSSHGEAECCP